MYITIEIEELRGIITGRRQYKKCPSCDKQGYEYWEETGTSVLPYPHPDWGDNYERGKCAECDGLAYISILKE